MEKAKKIKSLEGIQRVRFNDFSEYESEKSANGGAYGFWTDYTRLENGMWEVSYGTTAEFDFCPVCGSSMITVSKTELTSAVSSRRSAKRN